MSRRSTDLGLDKNEVRVLERREKHGWFVNIIAEDADGPGFAYSLALYEEFSHPGILGNQISEKSFVIDSLT
jgi:hypothetical protein